MFLREFLVLCEPSADYVRAVLNPFPKELLKSILQHLSLCNDRSKSILHNKMIEIGGDEIMLRFEKLGFIGQQKYVVKRQLFLMLQTRMRVEANKENCKMVKREVRTSNDRSKK